MKYGYIERRYLFRNDLRVLCIRKNWYTCGDNKEYDNLLHSFDEGNITTDVIVEIATDIVEHSDNISLDDITSVMFEIADCCYITFEEV